ncbi:hypothetical protein F8388_019009 [Cannabis sativa]|uniref:Transposase-associated domain-containing protein n=1 Tax=Cannabis sativa TaxID=3483 RepID=A0A7J6H2G2_CANSA|nr:hypothetical protein F8388_019009 [Cannabis sativa]
MLWPYRRLHLYLRPVNLNLPSFKMDRSLMSANRLSVEYSEGVDHFLDFCQKYAKNPKLVLCPFLKCCNIDITRINEHIFRNDIDKSYKVWVHHGEKNRVSGEEMSKSNNTLSKRFRRILLAAISSVSSQSSSLTVKGFFSMPNNALGTFCWLRRSFILLCKREKLSLSQSFSISSFWLVMFLESHKPLYLLGPNSLLDIITLISEFLTKMWRLIGRLLKFQSLRHNYLRST